MHYSVFYIIFALILLFLIALAFFFVRHYVQKDESYIGTLLVCSASIVVVLLTLFLVPLDVYSVSSSLAPDGSQSNVNTAESLQSTIKVLYYIFYGLIVFLGFICLPFAYFYFEAGDEGREGRRPTTRKKVFRALYYTAFFVIAFAIFIAVAFIVKSFRSTPHEDDWKRRIIGRFDNIDALLTFTVALLSFLGLLFYVPYAAYGLAALPIYLMKSRPDSVQDEKRALLLEEQDLSASYRTQQAESSARNSSVNSNSTLSRMADKYGYASRHGGNISTTRKDRRLQETERKLDENKRKQEALTNYSSFWTKCWNSLGVFRIVIGIILLLVSLLIFAQNVINIVDRFMHSTCKWSCGFSIDQHTPSIINPIDASLKFLSRGFPADLIIYTALVLYIFICLLYAVTSIGIRFFCIKLQELSPHNTPANAIILAVACLCVAALTINTQLITAVPQYSTFGVQFYLSSDKLDSMWMDLFTGGRNKEDYAGKHLSSPLTRLIPSSDTTTVIDDEDDRVVNVSLPRAIDGPVYNLPKMTDNTVNRLDIIFFGEDAYMSPILTDDPEPEPEPEPDDGDDGDGGDDDDDPDPKPDPDPEPTPGPVTKKSCTLERARKNDKCIPTQASTFMQKTHHYLPIFSIFHLFANLAFQFLFICCLIYALCTRPKTRVIQSDDPDAANFYN